MYAKYTQVQTKLKVVNCFRQGSRGMQYELLLYGTTGMLPRVIINLFVNYHCVVPYAKRTYNYNTPFT